MITQARSVFLWATLVIAGAALVPVHACDVVDLMPQYWRSIDAADAPARLMTEVISPHPDLYNPDFVALPQGAKWIQLVSRERTYVDAHREAVLAAERALREQAQPDMTQFERTFPDYRCDYTFYIAPSFGEMDGATGFVNGQHRIIFAPDVIARYHPLSELKVLIDHETFHIYHHEATGTYGASAEAVPTIQQALWSEGLATFVSWRMNPDASLEVALLQPRIPERAQPHLAAIAADVLVHLDTRDKATYEHYFEAGKQPEGYPPRAGYYLGVLLAQELSSRYTLQQLARLHDPQLRNELTRSLRQIADSDGQNRHGR